MLEKFTAEEIEQIKKELKAAHATTLINKTVAVKDQLGRLEKIYPRELFMHDNIWLCPSSEIKDCLFIIVDHILKNYKPGKTVKFHKPCYERVRGVNYKLQPEYERVVKELIDVIERNNVEWEEIKDAD